MLGARLSVVFGGIGHDESERNCGSTKCALGQVRAANRRTPAPGLPRTQLKQTQKVRRLVGTSEPGLFGLVCQSQPGTPRTGLIALYSFTFCQEAVV